MKNFLPANSFRVRGSHFTQVGRNRAAISLSVQGTLVANTTTDAVVPGAVWSAGPLLRVVRRVFFSRAIRRCVKLRVTAESTATALVHGGVMVVYTLQAAVRVAVHGVRALQGTVL